MTSAERKASKLAWWRAYTAANRDKVRAYSKAYYAEHRADISAWGKTYRAENTDRIRAAERTWRLAHQAKKRAHRKAHYVAHRMDEIAKAKAYRDTHPEEWRAWHAQYSEKNREAISKKNAAWALANQGHLAAYRRTNAGSANARTAKRRATLLRATPAWADWAAIEAIYREAARLTRDTGIKHEVDHIYPLQGRTLCGLHVAGNLRNITKLENVRKGNRIMPHTDPLQSTSGAAPR